MIRFMARVKTSKSILERKRAQFMEKHNQKAFFFPSRLFKFLSQEQLEAVVKDKGEIYGYTREVVEEEIVDGDGINGQNIGMVTTYMAYFDKQGDIMLSFPKVELKELKKIARNNTVLGYDLSILNEMK